MLSQTVNRAVVTVSVFSGLNPSITLDDTVVFAAAVLSTPGLTPTGTITFIDGSSVLATVTLSSGVATFGINTLSVGIHQITAVYSGDADFEGKTSSALSQIVFDQS